ncbi:MAG: manganese efflux pump [Blautia sp.]|jgi:putative Mn2+ efflux pump MntP
MQLHLLSFLLFGISSNIDSLVAGLSYGIKKTPVTWQANLTVGLISLAGTVLSMLFGKSVLLLLPPFPANTLGGLIVILIGIVGLCRFFLPRAAKQAAADSPHVLRLREAMLLGLALTVNNMGLGIGASITGLTVAPTAGCSFLFSLLFFYAGNRAGHTKLSAFAGRAAEPLANFLMIALGLYEIFI